MDADLEDMSRDQLVLPEQSDYLPVIPDWPEFLRGCIRYRQSLDEQLPQAPRSNKPYPE